MSKPSVFSLLPEDIQSAVLFSKPYIYKQFYEWIYSKRTFAPDQMTNISLKDRMLLNESFSFITLNVIESAVSQKTLTKKFVLKAQEGKLFEAVLIPDKNNGKFTLCLSTQIGCSFACAFCATGTMGLQRNLTAGEIVEQYLVLDELCERKIGNIVFMGMGEPFANQDEVFKAIEVLTNETSFRLSPARLTISTSGVLSGVNRLSESMKKINLMISLHSAVQKTRDELMPNLKGQTLLDLSDTLLNYQKKTGLEIGFEFIMIEGLTDTSEELNMLIRFVSKFRNSKVNLIAFNSVAGKNFKPSRNERIKEFVNVLTSKGIIAVQRYKKGDDLAAACGQLVIK